jgi:hypothetical protein
MSQDLESQRERDRPVGEGDGRLDRRRFLSGAGGAAAALATGVAGLGSLLAPNEARAAAVPPATAAATLPPAVLERRERSFQVRFQAALTHRRSAWPVHAGNGDEERYPNRIGSYSKGLPHNAFGEVEEDAYDSLLAAVRSGVPEDFEAIRTSGGRRLTSPQAGLAFDLEGYDAQQLTAPPAPALGSAEEAGEAVELYWMALLRDVSFLDYEGHPDAAAAAADLNSLSVFKGARRKGRVNARSLFRDPLAGCLNGPYISQFLWLPATYGAEFVDRRMLTQLPGSDHLTRFSDWLETQNGFGSLFSRPDPVRRYILNGRDLAEWVHNDVLFQAYFNACLILGAQPNPFDPQTDGGIGCPTNPGNPYRASRNQLGFATFGGPHQKTLLCEVATRALKATWYQKWFVHRRLRPEEFGGLVHLQRSADRYPGVLHRDILESPALDRVWSRHGSYLMPMAFPEGSPTHPSYTAGHATVAGACVTILKWLYDESFVIHQPVIPTPDGLALQPYAGPPLTVGGELNKLASNIATGRNIAGVHWRSDALASLRLGEEIAIGILRDQRAMTNEVFHGATFTRFDGTRITV